MQDQAVPLAGPLVRVTQGLLGKRWGDGSLFPHSPVSFKVTGTPSWGAYPNDVIQLESFSETSAITL